MRTQLDIFTARTQAYMFVLWSVAFLGFLFVLVLLKTQLDDTVEKLVYTMLGVIGAKVGEQSSFFFQRARVAGIPDPATTTTTSTTTTTPTPSAAPATVTTTVTPSPLAVPAQPANPSGVTS